jgi:two-component system, OmpR family, phosphate regulon sensor histidine kinase PhoR
MAIEERRETGREKLRRGWLVVAAATLLAVLALGAEINPLFVAAGWLLMFLSLLLSPSLPGEELPSPPALPAPRPARDPLDDLAGAYAALDLPVIVLGGDGHVLFQNAAAEKAFDVMQPGTHLSARLRSPGILDMVRETVATGQSNQIEHSERHPSERVFILRVAPVELPGPEAARSGPYFALTAKDISELRRIDRMRSDFVANASHELRTPLASMGPPRAIWAHRSASSTSCSTRQPA